MNIAIIIAIIAAIIFVLSFIVPMGNTAQKGAGLVLAICLIIIAILKFT